MSFRKEGDCEGPDILMNPAARDRARQQGKTGLATGDGKMSIGLCCTVPRGSTRRKELLCSVLLGWLVVARLSPDN
jgi:hypothetical protein